MKACVETNSRSTLDIYSQMSSKIFYQQQEVSKLRNSLKTSLTSASSVQRMWSLSSTQTSRSSGRSSSTGKALVPFSLSTHLLCLCLDILGSSRMFFRTTLRYLISIIRETRKRQVLFSIQRNSQRFSPT